MLISWTGVRRFLIIFLDVLAGLRALKGNCRLHVGAKFSFQRLDLTDDRWNSDFFFFYLDKFIIKPELVSRFFSSPHSLRPRRAANSHSNFSSRQTNKSEADKSNSVSMRSLTFVCGRYAWPQLHGPISTAANVHSEARQDDPSFTSLCFFVSPVNCWSADEMSLVIHFFFKLGLKSGLLDSPVLEMLK